jgi:hypothetical protein
MRKGQTAEAEILTKSIGQNIVFVRANFLNRASLKDTKHLWILVNDSSSVLTMNNTVLTKGLAPDDLNADFSKIANDSTCD